MLKPLQRIRVLLTLSALQVLLCLADTFPELQSQFAGGKYDPSRIQMEIDEVEELRSVHFSVPTEADHHFVMFGSISPSLSASERSWLVTPVEKERVVV
jgi:hypothetical protein